MGYETEAFVVERYRLNRRNQGVLGNPECLHTLGKVDLSKDGGSDTNFGKLRLAYTKNPIDNGRIFGLWKFGYNGSGKEYIYKDKYDEPIVLIPIHEAIRALEKDEEYYRRFDMLLQLLKATVKGFQNNIDDIYVACYGH